jgi:hypothetical protein
VAQITPKKFYNIYVEKYAQHLNIDYNFDHQMLLRVRVNVGIQTMEQSILDTNAGKQPS